MDITKSALQARVAQQARTGPRTSDDAKDLPSDKVEIGSTPTPTPPGSAKSKLMMRFGNDVVVQVGLGDLPALAALAADTGLLHLSPKAHHTLDVINGVNVAMNFVGMGIDAYQLHDLRKRPDSDPIDKKVEGVHLFVGDAIPTATSVLPLIFPHMNDMPLVNALFLGTQIMGIAADVAKLGYDTYRHWPKS